MQTLRPRLLVVDDDRAILTLIGTIALAEGFDVATTISGEDAMKQIRHRPVDLVLLDLRMPGITGLDVLRAIREINPRVKVVLMTGYGTIDTAVEAVKLGAVITSRNPSTCLACVSCCPPCGKRPSSAARCSPWRASWRSGWSSAAWLAAARQFRKCSA